MKKMLTLVLVLAVASLANAMTLSIGGAPASLPIGGDTPLTVESSGFAQGEYVYWALVCTSSVGTVSGGAVTAAAPDASGILNWSDIGSNFEPYGLGIVGNVDTFSTSPTYTAPGGTYFDSINFHCNGPGTAVVQLWTTVDFSTYNLADTKSILQVPEPITMALLGVGGLFFRRRKSA